MSDRRPFTKLLVANRGEIARRVFATCRRLGIATVAVHSEPDAEAPFVAEADEAVALGGVGAAESYLDFDKLLAAADATGADAVHPGYGFGAENAELARAVAAAELVWVGPAPEAIAAMGSKLRARELIDEAGVPVLPGAELDGRGAAGAAERIGLPLLVKASAGGGGKGMRIVRADGELEPAIAAARREAEAAFGDGTVFLERFLERPRHVEVQVLADLAGTTVSLGERECSIQRRHQKVIEESPSVAVDERLRERLGAAAVAAARAVDYAGVGTVEFLLSPDGEFFFLEMNTRLQVEHPVTELVRGIDLVQLQLLVAAGEPLPDRIAERPIAGHAIEARLYAEDPAAGHLPQTGVVERIAVAGAEPFAAPERRATPLLRLDSGVEDGSEVSPHYDPLLAKLICWAPSRRVAAARLAAALAGAELDGIRSNRDLLVRVLRHPAFGEGETDTGFLERHGGLDAPLVDAEAERLHAAAAALAAAAERRERAPVLGFAPSGYRNNRSAPQRIRFEGSGGAELEVGYGFQRGGLTLEVDGRPLAARLRSAGGAEVVLALDGVSRRYAVRRSGATHHVNGPAGQSSLRELPRYESGGAAGGEGELVAPMPGRVIAVRVAAGDAVAAGEVVLVLEAMKMEHELAAPAAGAVAELLVAEGDQVEAGAALAVIEEEGDGAQAGS